MAGTGARNGAGIQFYIPATTSLMERRPRTLKHGDAFGLFDHHGDIHDGPGSPEGLFARDTRHLSRFRLWIDGERPIFLSSTVSDDNLLLQVDLTNPDRFDERGRLVLPRDTVHLMRWRFLYADGLFERIRIENFDVEARTVEITLDLDADFADIFGVRDHHPRGRGRVRRTVDAARGRVELEHRARDGIVDRTVLAFEPRPAELTEGRAVFRLTVPPGRRRRLYVWVGVRRDATVPVEPPAAFAPCYRTARRSFRARGGRAAAVATSHEIFKEVLCRAVSDLYMLETDTPHGPYPYAGIPWFSTAFGRDGLITALETLWLDPEIARGVLAFLAATQAREPDPARDAEPGKILHEIRFGELARLGEVPFARYYGSIDSTPLFVLLAAEYHRRTGDDATLRALWPHLEAALSWIDEWGDRDGDGFVEYARARESGLANQGWKDSGDSVFHADGRLAEGPIALCEVQGYVYAAKRAAADLARRLGHEARAQALERAAAELRRRFDEAFWSEELGCYALALDGDKRPCLVRTSNAGQLLFTGIVPPARAARLAELLLSERFFSGFGIRTVAAGEARYNPMSYHNGSIWPHDNALIALGLARSGHPEAAVRVLGAIFDAAAYMDLRRLPELYCGFRRRPRIGPTLYPVACAPQAWAAGAILLLVQAALGLDVDGRARIVELRHPRLPPGVEEMRIRRLAVGDASVDLLLRRHGDDVAVNVLHREGDLDVEVRL